MPVNHGAGISDYYRCKRENEVACSDCKSAAAEYERNRRAANIEHHKRIEKEWRDRNVEKARASEKRWRDANPEKQREKHRRKRARKKEVESEPYTDADILHVYGIACHICEETIDLKAPRSCGTPGWERGLHLDHVISLKLGGADTIYNVKPSHGLCNIQKSAKTWLK
jgi:5-methylcytosine-specific restriction endonuclease McrA